MVWRHDCRGVFETGAAGEWRKFVIRFQSPLPARRTESAIYDRIYRIAFGCLYERRYAKSVHEYWETLDDRSKSSATTWPLVKRFVREMKSPGVSVFA